MIDVFLLRINDYYKWQLYVATCSPARDAGAGYVAWGHSTLIGPVSLLVYLFLFLNRFLFGYLMYCSKTNNNLFWRNFFQNQSDY